MELYGTTNYIFWFVLYFSQNNFQNFISIVFPDIPQCICTTVLHYVSVSFLNDNSQLRALCFLCEVKTFPSVYYFNPQVFTDSTIKSAQKWNFYCINFYVWVSSYCTYSRVDIIIVSFISQSVSNRKCPQRFGKKIPSGSTSYIRKRVL